MIGLISAAAVTGVVLAAGVLGLVLVGDGLLTGWRRES